MEQPFVTQQRLLKLVVIQASQIWYAVLQVQLELVLALYHGHGIRQQKLANALMLCIICREHHAV